MNNDNDLNLDLHDQISGGLRYWTSSMVRCVFIPARMNIGKFTCYFLNYNVTIIQRI